MAKRSRFTLPNVSAASLLSQPFSLLQDAPKEKALDFESLLTPPPSFAKPRPIPGVSTLPGSSQVPGAKPLPWSPEAPVSMKNMINTSTYHGAGSHITDGLDMNKGRKTAVDIMAKPGTPVGAPTSGVVQRLGSAQGGDSMYFKADNGRTYWLGHIDSRYSLPPGSRVKAGQMLTRISADHPAPHLHLDASW